MTKEKLQNELENYKTLYLTQKKENERLNKEQEDIEAYKQLNLELQVRVAKLERENKELKHYNQLLSNQNEVYKEVYDLLKEDKIGDNK